VLTNFPKQMLQFGGGEVAPSLRSLLSGFCTGASDFIGSSCPVSALEFFISSGPSIAIYYKYPFVKKFLQNKKRYINI